MYIFTLLTGSSHRSHSPVSAARAIKLPVQQDGEGSSVSPPGLNMETLQQQKHGVQVAHTASECVCRHTEAIHFTAHAETCRRLLTKSPVPSLISYRQQRPFPESWALSFVNAAGEVVLKWEEDLQELLLLSKGKFRVPHGKRQQHLGGEKTADKIWVKIHSQWYYLSATSLAKSLPLGLFFNSAPINSAGGQ